MTKSLDQGRLPPLDESGRRREKTMTLITLPVGEKNYPLGPGRQEWVDTSRLSEGTTGASRGLRRFMTNPPPTSP